MSGARWQGARVRLPLAEHEMLRAMSALIEGVPYAPLDPAPPSGWVESRVRMSRETWRTLREERQRRLAEGEPGATVSHLVGEMLRQLSPPVAAWHQRTAGRRHAPQPLPEERERLEQLLPHL